KPTSGFTGADSFTYQASDGTTTGNTVTVTLNVSNTAPVAVADTYAVPKNANPYAGASELGRATGVKGDPITAVLVAGPSKATAITLKSDGTFSYKPTSGFTGADSFTYQANDGTTSGNTVTVTLTVTNTAPVAVADTYAVPKNANPYAGSS